VHGFFGSVKHARLFFLIITKVGRLRGLNKLICWFSLSHTNAFIYTNINQIYKKTLGTLIFTLYEEPDSGVGEAAFVSSSAHVLSLV